MRKYAFSSRVVDNWNALPDWVVTSETVQKFKANLDKYWKNQEQIYNYRAQIGSTTQEQPEQPQNSQDYLELESQAA